MSKAKKQGKLAVICEAMREAGVEARRGSVFMRVAQTIVEELDAAGYAIVEKGKAAKP